VGSCCLHLLGMSETRRANNQTTRRHVPYHKTVCCANMCACVDNVLDKSVWKNNFVCELFYGSCVCMYVFAEMCQVFSTMPLMCEEA